MKLTKTPILPNYQVQNGAISIMQRCFINDWYKVNTIGHYFISNLSMLDALKKKFLIFHLDNFLIPVQYKRLLDTLCWIGILLTLTHVFVVCLGYILWMGNLNTLALVGSIYTFWYSLWSTSSILEQRL